MKHFLSLFLVLIMVFVAKAQRPNFSEDIAQIIYQNCSKCHRPGEIGPMPFTNYQEVKAYGSTIEFVTSINYMPPWTPDPNYRHFLDERFLSVTEKTKIKDWVTIGMPQGDPNKEPPFPNFPTGSQLGTPDLVLSWSESYLHKGNNADMYRVFVLPSSQTSDVDIAAIEFRADNKDIAHHAILALDTTGRARQFDMADPEYGYLGFGGFGFSAIDVNWRAWVPGAGARFFPPGIGKKLYKNADVLVQMHYGPTSVDQRDSSSINVFFSKSPVQRYIITVPALTPSQLTNGPFVIPPNQRVRFKASVSVPADVSILEIAPHNHLLGRDWLVYAVTPNKDTINMIKIKEWDFNWQGNFAFPKLLKLPAGSTVYSEATFDNTVANPFNPNNPPKQVTWGEGTEDEMYLVYFSFVPYLPGDENISLGELDKELFVKSRNFLFPVNPNPSDGKIILGYELMTRSKVKFEIYNVQGSLVHSRQSKEEIPGKHKLRMDLSQLSSGLYYVQMHSEAGSQIQKIILSK